MTHVCIGPYLIKCTTFGYNAALNKYCKCKICQYIRERYHPCKRPDYDSHKKIIIKFNHISKKITTWHSNYDDHNRGSSSSLNDTKTGKWSWRRVIGIRCDPCTRTQKHVFDTRVHADHSDLHANQKPTAYAQSKSTPRRIRTTTLAISDPWQRRHLLISLIFGKCFWLWRRPIKSGHGTLYGDQLE